MFGTTQRPQCDHDEAFQIYEWGVPICIACATDKTAKIKPVEQSRNSPGPTLLRTLTKARLYVTARSEQAMAFDGLIRQASDHWYVSANWNVLCSEGNLIEIVTAPGSGV